MNDLSDRQPGEDCDDFEIITGLWFWISLDEDESTEDYCECYLPLDVFKQLTKGRLDLGDMSPIRYYACKEDAVDDLNAVINKRNKHTNTPEVGKLITGQAFRDAIHVAIAPVVAGEQLAPGTRVVLVNGVARDGAWIKTPSIGIVDPFLERPVYVGEKFYIFLFPNTVTSLRHAWTHPAFTTQVPKKEES